MLSRVYRLDRLATAATATLLRHLRRHWRILYQRGKKSTGVAGVEKATTSVYRDSNTCSHQPPVPSPAGIAGVPPEIGVAEIESSRR